MFSNKKILFIISFSFFLIFPHAVHAQIVINEVSPVSDPEWVEIYNNGAVEASLKDYVINFGNENQNKIFCEQDFISAGGYKLITLTSSWLSNSGDQVILKKGSEVIDNIGYGTGYTLDKPLGTGSITRLPDGSNNWIVSDTSTTQGDQTNFDCPTPTPSPSPTITSQPTEAPTATPTKTAYQHLHQLKFQQQNQQ